MPATDPLSMSAENSQAYDWRRSLALAAACVLGVRLLLTVYMAWLSFSFPQPELRDFYAHTELEVMTSGWEGALLGVWQREDALWYQKIATVGYSTSDMTPQLFPLFPMAMRFLMSITGLHPVLAGILISEVSLVVALCLLHQMLLPRFGLGVADRTLLYISLFPTAFFLHAPFTESLMLALVVGSFTLVSRGHWLGAVVTAYLAGLTRPQGMLLGLPLAVQFLRSVRVGLHWKTLTASRGDLMRAAALLTAPTAGFLTFAAFVEGPWRSPGFQGGVGPMAKQSLAIPGTPIVYSAQRILDGVAYPIDVFDFLVATTFVVLAILSVRRLEPGYSLYALVFLLAPLSRFSPVFPLMSFSRFVLLLFPCFVVLAILGKRKSIHLGIGLAGITFMLLWAWVYYLGGFVA